MLIKVKNKDTLLFDDFIFRCVVGKKEFQRKKGKEISVHRKDPLSYKQSIIDTIELKILKQN